MVSASFLGSTHTGNQRKVERTGSERLSRYFGLFAGAEVDQNSAVAAKLVIRIPDNIVAVGVQFIVVGISAQVRAELFV